MLALFDLVFDLFQLDPHPFRVGLPPDPEPSVLRPRADMRESQERLDFRHHAAGLSQARRMAWSSAGVGCSGRAHRNLAATRTRRSLPSMSAVEGWVFVRYHGARARCSATSAGS